MRPRVLGIKPLTLALLGLAQVVLGEGAGLIPAPGSSVAVLEGGGVGQVVRK